MEFIIYPPNSNTAFYFFDLPIRWYGIIMALCIFFGVIFSQKMIDKYCSFEYSKAFSDNFPFLVFFSVAGARLFYVFAKFEFYKNNPLEIIMINHGGLSVWGAIIFGIISVYLYSKYKKLNYYKFFDIFACIMPICQAIGRWGNFFNQEAYGMPSNSFLKLYVSEGYRTIGYENYSYFHPAFLYESILDIIIFFILYKFFKIKKTDGVAFYLYLILYSFVRIITEQIRTDSILNIGSIHIAQIIAFLVLACSCFGLYILKLKAKI